MKTIPDGVYPTMITPFTEDLQVDYQALEPLLRWYERRGVAGMFAVCASSEMFHMSYEESIAIVRRLMAVRQPGTVMLASGHVSHDLPTATRQAQGFLAEGVDAYVFVTNRLAAPDEEDDVFLRRLETIVKALGDATLGFYECPDPKRLLTPAIIRRLPELGNFAFLKDTCCDVEQIRQKLAAARGSGFKIFNANSAMLLESLRAGCAGYSGVMANFHPQLYAKLCQCHESELELAQRIQRMVGALSCAEGMQYPVNAKYHMALDGVPVGIAARCRDAADFGLNAQCVTRHLWALTRAFGEELGL